ncbi:MAG TPA: CADD family putative folate metabolism protein [Longimicrobiales bacterium]|nr:CADD family putative folate metabolism protein [Longimicrobiales bacterium]
MPSSHVLRELDAEIAKRSILRHPFYQAWERGELTREDLATYARVYYPHVRAFPGYLEAALAHAEDPAVRAELRDNLADELGNPAPHDALWLDFAAAMGADPEQVRGAPAHPAARAIVSTFEDLARASLATGVAALYAYESQQPGVSRTKLEGLRACYGVSDPAALAYFEVHEEADVRHRQGERDALAACLEAGVRPEVVHAAAGRALDAYWGLLDGVAKEIGLGAQTLA